MKKIPGLIPVILVVFLVVLGAASLRQRQGGLLRNMLSNTGETVRNQREVSKFNKILLSGHGNIVLEQGEEVSLKVEAGENLMEYITTEVSGDELKISYRPLPPDLINFNVNYYITVNEVEKIQISGSGKLDSSLISTNEIELVISGSGEMAMVLNTEKLNTAIDGSGQYQLSGTAGEQTIKIEGSGKYYGRELAGQIGNVTIAGSGKAEVNVSEELAVSIAGSGAVYYLGEPAMDNINISGSGKVEKL